MIAVSSAFSSPRMKTKKSNKVLKCLNCEKQFFVKKSNAAAGHRACTGLAFKGLKTFALPI